MHTDVNEPRLVSLDMTEPQRQALGQALQSVVNLIVLSVNAYPPPLRATIHQQLERGAEVEVAFHLHPESADIDCLMGGQHLFTFALPKRAATQLQ
jgi:hypothetical protein